MSRRSEYIRVAVVNAVIGVVVLVVAAASGSSILRAVVAVLLAWAAGTAYAFFRIRSRPADADRRDA